MKIGETKLELKINKRLQKKCKKNYRKEKKWMQGLWLFEKILLYGYLAYLLLNPIYCILTGKYVSMNGSGEKSYGTVFEMTLIFASMGLTAALLVSVLRKKLEGVFLGGRDGETFEIKDNLLFYIFHIAFETPADMRNVVVIDLSRIQELSFNESTGKITIKGQMVEKTVSISSNLNRIAKEDMTNSIIQICDYFSPSLYSKLKEIVSIND